MGLDSQGFDGLGMGLWRAKVQVCVDSLAKERVGQEGLRGEGLSAEGADPV